MHDKHLDMILSSARQAVCASNKRIEREATELLRSSYKGKRAKLECFDSLFDGDAYVFDTEILDIRVHKQFGSSIEFIVTVDVMHKSIFFPQDPPKVCCFYLEKICKVYE